MLFGLFSVIVTMEECDKKWRNLLVTYKRIADNGHKTGRGGKSWLYFDRMDEVVGKLSGNVSLAHISQRKSTVSSLQQHNDDLFGPSSDVEPEDVVVEKSVLDMGEPMRKKCKRQRGLYGLMSLKRV